MVKNMDGANGQTGGKNSCSTFVLTAFNSFGQFSILRRVPKGPSGALREHFISYLKLDNFHAFLKDFSALPFRQKQ